MTSKVKNPNLNFKGVKSNDNSYFKNSVFHLEYIQFWEYHFSVKRKNKRIHD